MDRRRGGLFLVSFYSLKLLKKLNISNFKMFEYMELNFEPEFNLLLGDKALERQQY